jgi:arylsulfatase A-like enzyme
MDTVRADHVSCYGYHRKTTPNIDTLAVKGVLFKKAFSAATWTPPSHASIFTGKYPFQHGTFGQNVRFKERYSIATILQHHGYKTLGITDCGLISSITNFDKGFDIFINTSEIPLLNFKFVKAKIKDAIRTFVQGLDKHTYRINEILKEILIKNIPSKRPFFLFVNYFNAHAPYWPPKPFRNKFTSNHRANLNYGRIKRIARRAFKQDFLRKKINISKEEWNIITSLYDAELAYLDHRIGEFVKFLENKGIFDDTLLIITSDHGEYFGEHGLAGHVLNLYDEILHVPLIMIYPSIIPKQKRISHIVSTIDIFSTVMKIVGIRPILRGKLPSVSLFPFGDKKVRDFIFAESDYAVPEEKRIPEVHKKCRCIRTESYKYICSQESEELYDLTKDPCEQNNLARELPEKTDYFRKILHAVIHSFGEPLTLEEQKIIMRLRRQLSRK